VAQSLHDLANVYYRRGRYATAEELYKRALTIREEALGQSHPDVALTLHNLAYLHTTQGKYDSAEIYYKVQQLSLAATLFY